MERWLINWVNLFLNLHDLALERGDREQADKCMAKVEEGMAKLEAMGLVSTPSG